MSKKIFILSSIILIIDQVVKSIIDIYFDLNDKVVIIKNFFAITLAHNEGGAWSILSNLSFIFIIASIIAIAILIHFMFNFKVNTRNTIGFSLTLGGIISNLADRMFLGYVRDFLDFTIFGYDYPIFNIADIAIVTGVILLIIAIIKGEDKGAKVNKQSKKHPTR